jgi:hypothetical protein
MNATAEMQWRSPLLAALGPSATIDSRALLFGSIDNDPSFKRRAGDICDSDATELFALRKECQLTSGLQRSGIHDVPLESEPSSSKGWSGASKPRFLIFS